MTNVVALQRFPYMLIELLGTTISVDPAEHGLPYYTLTYVEAADKSSIVWDGSSHAEALAAARDWQPEVTRIIDASCLPSRGGVA